ncbi:MAG: hypothetical protein AAFO89_10620 [Planctomycetota bacterium]
MAICILIAVLLVLHACTTSIRDSEELHGLAVRVHTVRNEYLANLRGGAVEIVADDIVEVEPVGSIGPEPDASASAA